MILGRFLHGADAGASLSPIIPARGGFSRPGLIFRWRDPLTTRSTVTSSAEFTVPWAAPSPSPQ